MGTTDFARSAPASTAPVREAVIVKGSRYEAVGVDPVPGGFEAEAARQNALADAATDHDGIAALMEHQRQKPRHELLRPTQAPLPAPEDAAAALADARLMLGKTIEARGVAECDLQDAADALRRGREAADAARGALQALGDVDGTIAAYRAGRIASWKSVDPLPADLAHRRTEHDRLLREIADAERTGGVLTGKVNASQGTLSQATERVAEAVASVIDHQAELLAVAMILHQEEAFMLRRRISALQNLMVGTRHFRLSLAVDQALRVDPQPWTSTTPAERAVPLRDWYRITEALTADADAQMEVDDG